MAALLTASARRAGTTRRPLFTFLSGTVEGLRHAFERKGIDRLRAFGGNALDHGIIAAPHGIDHFGLVGGVFDPGAVLLGVEREARAPDLGGGLGPCLE